MQRNYCSPLLRRSPEGLRRGPSSSEPYRPSSSPPARMLLPAEHSPLGSQHFGNIATPVREPRTPGQVGGLAAWLWALVHRAQVEPCFKLSVQLRDSHASHGVGKGAEPPRFIHLGGVDCGVLASSSDFPFAGLSLQIGLLWELGLTCFPFEFTLDPCTTSAEGHSTRFPSSSRARALPEQVGCGPGGS